jgi:hypothetical protein
MQSRDDFRITEVLAPSVGLPRLMDKARNEQQKSMLLIFVSEWACNRSLDELRRQARIIREASARLRERSRTLCARPAWDQRFRPAPGSKPRGGLPR